MLRSLNLKPTPVERQQPMPLNGPTVPLHVVNGQPLTERALLAAGARLAEQVLPQPYGDAIAAVLMAHAGHAIVQANLGQRITDRPYQRAVALARCLVNPTA